MQIAPKCNLEMKSFLVSQIYPKRLQTYIYQLNGNKFLVSSKDKVKKFMVEKELQCKLPY